MVRVHGEHDVFTAPALREQVHAAIEQSAPIVIDLSGATFIDSSVLAVLLGGLRRAREGEIGYALILPGRRWRAGATHLRGHRPGAGVLHPPVRAGGGRGRGRGRERVSVDAPQLQLLLPAAPENVVVARQAITGLCEGLGFPSRATDDVRLAVTEACTNVVVHAYAPDTVAAQLEVEAMAVDHDLLVTVRDQGRGMGVFTGAAGPRPRPAADRRARRAESRCAPARAVSAPRIAMTFSKDGSDQDAHV